MSDYDPSKASASVGLGRHEMAGSHENMEFARNQRVKLVELFHKLNPPTFAGTEGPEAAEAFLKGVEKIFRLLECTNEERVLLATYSLQQEADSWWEATSENIAHEYGGNPWEQFRRAFLDKYFPLTIREDKAREFDLLEQTEEITVDQYEAKFSELSRYAPELVNTPEKRARKFEKELLPRIRNAFAALMLTNYGELYRRALHVEKMQRKCKERELGKGKAVAEAERSRESTRCAKRGRFIRRGGSSGAPRFSDYAKSTTVMPSLACPRCGRWHVGWVCPVMSKEGILCYQCGKSGHMRRNCPQNRRPVSTRMPGAPRGRGGVMSTGALVVQTIPGPYSGPGSCERYHEEGG